MVIDDLTKRRIEKELAKRMDEMLTHPQEKVRDFAGGMHSGALKILHILGIEIEKYKD
ncbi:hypothetical protein WKH57_01460 [Niallia taxi]|uniref:hypothetical protein n=1 Tax=Niallia taxi TaxID=2499688 RepID=UPI00317780E3